MANEGLVQFAEELKTARESKKITLQQISNKTKIDIKFLEAIEEAKFDIMPDLYIRAFIKEFAQIVDLNPDEIIKKFDSIHHGKKEEKPIHEEKKEINEEPVKKEFGATEETMIGGQTEQTKKKPMLNYNIGIAAAFVILVLVYFLFIRQSTPEIITEQTSNNGEVEDSKPAFEVDTPKTAANFVPVNDSLQLTVNTTKRVWVKVVSDQNVKYEGMVNAESRINYYASKQFRVVVGNAGSVKLAFNGKPIDEETVGKIGEVRNIIISPDTVRAYTIIIPQKDENASPQTN